MTTAFMHVALLSKKQMVFKISVINNIEKYIPFQTL